MGEAIRIPSKRKIPNQVKSEVIKKVVRTALIHSSKSCLTRNNIKSKLHAMKVTFLRSIKERTKTDMIRNEIHIYRIIYEKISETELRWFGL